VVVPAEAAEVDCAPHDWLLTSEVADCGWARRAGARTVLVGIDATASASQPVRCDIAVGSVYGAAIEVIVGEGGG
jgi:hypothetical protein